MEQSAQPGAEQAPAQETIVERSAGGDGPLSPREAALSLIDNRNKGNAQARKAQDDEPATPATPESTPQGEDAAPPQEATGETQEANPAEEPLLERPRSWSKEREAAWTKLDRDTQQYLLDHDREASATVRTAQNEAAEKLKGLTAKEQQAEQVRSHYETTLPLLLNTLQEQHAGEFSDIKSMADVQRLAREDWPRYVLWDAQQKNVAAVQQELQQAQTRQATEKQQKWQSFASEQDALFLEKAPEFADKDKAAKAHESASELLHGLGFKDNELAELWHGKKDLSLRDHRVQLLLRDGVRYREAQAKAKVAQAKPVPQVQRPGTARPSTADADARVQALDQRLTQSGNLRDAAKLLLEQRRARSG
jgi:hypothetical protein